MLLRSALVLTIPLLAGWAWGFPADDKPLTAEELAAVKQEVQTTLNLFKPAKGKNVPHLSSSDKGCTIWGNLFGDGRIFAVTSFRKPRGGTAYAEWQKDHWEFCNAWLVYPAWIAKGENKEDLGYNNVNPPPPENSYKLMDVNGDGVPDLLIAFNNDGSSLGYAIAIYNKRSGTLKLLDEYSGRETPDFKAGYLITHEAGGGKGWHWGDDFSMWNGGVLEWKASWRVQATPEYEPIGGITLIDLPGEKPGTQISFLLKPGGEEKDAPSYVVERDGQKLGTIRFREYIPKSANKPLFENVLRGAEDLWLFQSFTHLPWQAACKNQTGDSPADECKRLQKFLSVEVTGTPELLKLLGPAVKELNGGHAK